MDWGNGEVGKWGSGEMGKWGNGEVGRWGSGEMGRWGSGAFGRNFPKPLNPYHPITPKPYLLTPFLYFFPHQQRASLKAEILVEIESIVVIDEDL